MSIEGIRYPCNWCDYVTYNQSAMDRHKDKKHFVRYLCDYTGNKVCHFSALSKEKLNHHKEKSHVRVFRCDHCDFSAKTQHRVKTHARCHNISSQSENAADLEPANSLDHGQDKSHKYDGKVC